MSEKPGRRPAPGSRAAGICRQQRVAPSLAKSGLGDLPGQALGNQGAGDASHVAWGSFPGMLYSGFKQDHSPLGARCCTVQGGETVTPSAPRGGCRLARPCCTYREWGHSMAICCKARDPTHNAPAPVQHLCISPLPRPGGSKLGLPCWHDSCLLGRVHSHCQGKPGVPGSTVQGFEAQPGWRTETEGRGCFVHAKPPDQRGADVTVGAGPRGPDAAPAQQEGSGVSLWAAHGLCAGACWDASAWELS